MTGVAGRSIELRALVELTLQRDKLMNQARALEGRIGQLESWGQSIRSLIPAARAMNARGAPSSTLDDIAGLRRSAERALMDFRKDPDTARHPEIDAANIFWGQAFRKIGITEAAIRAEWRAFVNGSMPEYQPAVVEILGGSEADSIQAALAQAARRADGLAARLPDNDQAAEEVAAIAEECRSLLRTFDLEAMPQDVRVFIEAALSDQATLDLLTPAVRDWLVQRGVDRDVRLSFATRR